MQKPKVHKRISLTILIFYVFSVILPLQIWASDMDSDCLADFNMVYKIMDKSYVVNNRALPEMIGFKLPYSIYCTNLSKGAYSYEWFVKSPGQDYVKVDDLPNPVINIYNYGPTQIKLRINGSEKLTKEYIVTANEYGFSTKNEVVTTNEYNAVKNVSSVKTVIKTESAYITAIGDKPGDSKEMPFTKNFFGKSKFKISYLSDNKFYDVTDGVIPKTIATLPYDVNLTDTTDVNAECLWYIQLPGSDYVPMDDKRCPTANIWCYGTTKFKLVLNGDESNATEYSVTAYSSDKLKDFYEDISTRKNNIGTSLGNIIDRNNVKPEFKINYSAGGSVFDVTNATVPNSMCTLPYKVELVNLSIGEKTYDWSIKMPGSEKYEPVNGTEVNVSKYGPVSVKLRLNDNDNLIKENNVTSYFPANTFGNWGSGVGSVQPVPTSDVKADFKVLAMENGKSRDITNLPIIRQNKKEPLKLYMSNLSKGNEKDSWFIKFPGQEYVSFDNSPNPVAQIWQDGKIYFKLCINDNSQKIAEYSVDVYSVEDIPTILHPKKDDRVEAGNLMINWNQRWNSKTFIVTLINETKRCEILKNKIINSINSELVSKEFIESGCKYSLKVGCLETGLSDEITFHTNGTLNMVKRPADGNSTMKTAVDIENNKYILSQLYDLSSKDYYKFNLSDYSEISLELDESQNKNLVVEVLDDKYNIQSVGKRNSDGKLVLSRVLPRGEYYIVVCSDENAKTKDSAYNLSFGSKRYYPKTILLYAGYGSKHNMNYKYPQYSDSDLDKLIGSAKTSDFLILNSFGGSGFHEVIPDDSKEQIIGSAKLENNDDPKVTEMFRKQLWDKIEEFKDTNNDGVLEKNPDFIPYDRTLDSFADDTVKLALRLIEKNPNIRIWLSFPAPVGHTIAELYTPLLKDKVIYGIKRRLDEVNTSYWQNNILGFYYPLETIPTYSNQNNLGYLNDNSVLNSMRRLSQILHGEVNKLFLWIPYFGISPDNVRRIGYASDVNDIFDFSIIQPDRMFDGTDYKSKGIGDDQISILNDYPKVGEDVNVSVNCNVGQSVKINVLNLKNQVVFCQNVEGSTGLNFSFTPEKGLYTIIAEANNDGAITIFSKSIFIDYPPHWKNNMWAVVKSVNNNCVFFAGTDGTDGKKVAVKSSGTKIGFEMEMDAYSVIRPENIDFNNTKCVSFSDDYVNKVKWSSDDMTKQCSERAEELNKYYRYLTTQKNAWLREYLSTFKTMKNEYPVAFYCGDRNELLDGMNDGILNPSSGVIDTVLDFFEK